MTVDTEYYREWSGPKLCLGNDLIKKELLDMNLLTISSKLAKEEAVFQKLTAANSNSWLGTVKYNWYIPEIKKQNSMVNYCPHAKGH